ncbi:hypothetical protein [Bradyrhizobium liaoningense]|uniref:hypothetical protein n=1 Tax=Bradyrhizobium liaoningense TaxID=43992 RepID=UPI001BADF09D|nr:hypothetical protein [Bradyrhizobium liaoningense]MBR0716114.1 hypothetical protein [Bradyrhizobium liaoningense]
MTLEISEVIPTRIGRRVFAITGNTMPPRDPDDDEDEDEENDEGDQENQADEPPVVREPDED